MNILYTKASDYRANEYNLKTDIVEIDGERFARKVAVYKEGIPHLEKILSNADNLKKVMEQECGVCAVRKEDNAILFDYINGSSYEELLAEAYNEEDWARALEIIESYHKIVYKMCTQRGFCASEQFVDVFGEIQNDDTLDVGDFVDVDLIFSNVIYVDKPYIIDYEWCFNFAIPLQYVFWRGLFTSKIFSIFPDEIKEVVFDRYELTDERRKQFLGMEVAFVEHSKGRSLSFSDEIKKIRPVVFDANHLRWSGQSYPLVFFAIKNNEAKRIYEGVSYPGKNVFSLAIEDDYDRLELFIAPVLSVVSGIHVTTDIDGEERDIAYSTNESDDIEPKYFLKHTPVIFVEEKCSNIRVEFAVDIWNAESLGENNLNTYLNSINYVCDTAKSDLKVARKKSREKINAVEKELEEAKVKNTKMRRALQHKNVFKAFQAFIKVRNKENDF
ncbi:hypothetical protein [Butyrivibrio sp. AE2005]|uniref:hypothetical protein n=1 Tax=Butyrivibrio sp. AE2005 TaxID=1496722 RepID=UPI00047D9150|nr:hypothetical protein [Butyrivibrio sp. AE2005]